MRFFLFTVIALLGAVVSMGSVHVVEDELVGWGPELWSGEKGALEARRLVGERVALDLEWDVTESEVYEKPGLLVVRLDRHGLVNRIRSLSGAHLLATDLGYDIAVSWTGNFACGANWDDLFLPLPRMNASEWRKLGVRARSKGVSDAGAGVSGMSGAGLGVAMPPARLWAWDGPLPWQKKRPTLLVSDSGVALGRLGVSAKEEAARLRREAGVDGILDMEFDMAQESDVKLAMDMRRGGKGGVLVFDPDGTARAPGVDCRQGMVRVRRFYHKVLYPLTQPLLRARISKLLAVHDLREWGEGGRDGNRLFFHVRVENAGFDWNVVPGTEPGSRFGFTDSTFGAPVEAFGRLIAMLDPRQVEAAVIASNNVTHVRTIVSSFAPSVPVLPLLEEKGVGGGVGGEVGGEVGREVGDGVGDEVEKHDHSTPSLLSQSALRHVVPRSEVEGVRGALVEWWVLAHVRGLLIHTAFSSFAEEASVAAGCFRAAVSHGGRTALIGMDPASPGCGLLRGVGWAKKKIVTRARWDPCVWPRTFVGKANWPFHCSTHQVIPVQQDGEKTT